MAKTKLGKIHAFLGRSHRTGRWRLSPKTSVIALLGSCRLDLREAHLDGEVSKMTATVFLGGVTIVIPPGVEVRPSGLSLLGGASVDVPPFDEGEEVALIEIEWTSIFGRLRIGADFDTEEEVEAQVEQVASGDAPPAAAEAPAAAAPAKKKAAEPPKPPPAIGFEDLDEPADPPAPVGFEDLGDPPKAAEPAPSVGFEDLPEPAPSVGFEDLDEPAEPAAPVGFEDLDEPAETTEPAAPVGFEDLDDPADAAEATPNRRADDPAPETETAATDEGGDEGSDDAEPEPEPAAVGFEDLG